MVIDPQQIELSLEQKRQFAGIAARTGKYLECDRHWRLWFVGDDQLKQALGPVGG